MEKSMTPKQNAPVLIVGAGPTGLTLALTLRLHGVNVRLVDRAPAAVAVSKALAVWSGSMEALAGLGVIDEFLAAGERLRSVSIGDGKRTLATLPAGEGVDSPYPFPLLLPQSRTEAILGARAAALGVQVERAVELVGLVQDASGVTATLRHAQGGEETFRTQYVVGADGARSFVRQTLGIEFEGYTEPQTFLLGDIKISGGELDHRSFYIWWHDGGTVVLLPFEQDTWRMFAVRPDSEDRGQREDRSPVDQPATLEELQRHMDRHGPPDTRIHSPSWLSAFRTNERLAARYRVERVFLAGDAAHIHSPAGGQGMNTGIQDATNLGWKLAYVLSGRGEADLLLNSYEAERRPTARDVIAAAAQKVHVAFGSNWITEVLRDIAVTVIGNLEVARKKLQLDLSETDITYRDGPLLALGAQPGRSRRTDVGTRARDIEFGDSQSGLTATLWPILCSGRHVLLSFEAGEELTPLDDMTARFGADIARVRLGPDSDPDGKARDRYHMKMPGWVLIRPDQVVAARGGADDLALLSDYLDRVVRANAVACA
jgi:2-polyprenyl-6-methoxyphenol hydroxylase-like FAD-dependent oxidoreductase